MPRPKKNIDMKKLSELRAAGLSNRAIAKALGVSHTVINKVETFHPSRRESFHGGNKQPQPSASPSSERENGNFPPPSFVSSTKDTSPALPQLDAHHSQFSIRYVGNQPVSTVSFKPKNNIVYQFEDKELGVKLLAYGGKGNDHGLVAWINKAEGATPEEIAGKTSGRARLAIVKFAKEHAITPLWPTFCTKHEPHFIIKDKELNDLLLAILRENPKLALEMGVKAGDSSHPDAPEFVPKAGKQSVGTLLEILATWQSAKETTQNLAAFGNNTKTILEMISSRLERMEASQERITQIVENMAFILETTGFAEDKKPKRRLDT